MGQLGIATQRETTARGLPAVAAPAGQIPETPSSGPIVAPEGAAMASLKLASETIPYSELAWQGRTFVFNHPLTVRITREDGGWTFESEECGLMAYGLRRPEAESDFCFMFAECWDEIACESDEKLAWGARNQKRALLGLVKHLR